MQFTCIICILATETLALLQCRQIDINNWKCLSW